MAGVMVEPNIHAAWGAKQTAKGSPAAAASRRFKMVGGDLVVNPDYGSENYSDLDKYGDATDWLNSIVGNGSPSFEAQATELAWLLWIFHGQEVVTATVAPDPLTLNQHRFQPTNAPGFWATFWKRVGQTTIQRQKFNDCRASQVVIEASSANKAVRMTPTLISLDPGEVFDAAAEPTTAFSSSPVLIYTEAEGTFKLNATVIRGHSQFQLTLSEDLQTVFGDSTRPHALARGNANVGLGCTIQADDDGLARYNSEVYGTATPAAGAKPVSRVPLLGSYSFNMEKRDTAGVLIARLKVDIPGVRWQPLEAFAAPNPDGGTAEIALTGAMRKVSGQPPYTIDVVTDAAALTA